MKTSSVLPSLTKNRLSSGEPSSSSVVAYDRLSRHERSLWFSTVLIVLLSAATIALLTAGSAILGVFRGSTLGFILAGSSLLIFAVFLVYVIIQRQNLEENRSRILRELESWSGKLKQTNQAMEEALRTRTILTEGRGLLHLIEQVMDMTRLRSGTLRLHREQADLSGVLRDLLTRARPEARERKVILIGDLCPEPLPVRIDMDRIPRIMETLFRKLIGNSSAGEEVRVQSRIIDETWAEASLQGRLGLPVSQEEEENPFRPFAGLDPQPNGRAADLGLTLPLLKRYVIAHGGLVRIDRGPRGEAEVHIQFGLETVANPEDTPLEPMEPRPEEMKLPRKRAS